MAALPAAAAGKQKNKAGVKVLPGEGRMAGEAERSFDLVVIGSGSAAMTIAERCRAGGWSVAVVDSRPFGGTCALRGCDPKKVLIAGAEAIDWNRRFGALGIVAPASVLDWPALMRFKRSFTDPVPGSREKSLRDAGIAAWHGRARFTGPETLEVRGADGKSNVLSAAHIAIAAGAMPARLGIPGEELLIHSDQFLELDTLPRRLVFVGGGYISFELAHLAVRAGAEATILHRDQRPLAPFDPDLVSRLIAKTESVGIRVMLDSPVTAIAATAAGVEVRSGAAAYAADAAVHGAGRVAEIEDLGLAAAGVDWSPRGVKVNEFLQSPARPAVYAAGDAAATDGAPLTPVAGYEGGIAAENLLFGNRRTADYAGLASVAFTLPPLAAAGLSEAAARRRGLRFHVYQGDTGEWYSSRRIAEPYSGFKVLVEEGSKKILGAHLLAPEAGETINYFALAIRRGLTTRDLQDVLFAYPTVAGEIRYMLGPEGA